MVKIYTVILFLCFGSLAYGQIYVNASATGTNNGTSWANAFTKVESALAATGTNIWVAKGTYKPEGPANDTSAFFKMTTPKNIYGGFAGTETTLAARNIAANATIFSGDMLGNDNVDSLYVNKTDNRRHVLFIDSLVRGTVILDGLTVTGGATRTATGGTNRREWSGGGVITYTSMIVRNSKFLNNYSLQGGGIAIYGDSLFSTDVLVENTTFEKNLGYTSGNSGSGMYTLFVDSVVVNNSTSIKNAGGQGTIGIWNSTFAGINNCNFTENYNNTSGNGGGIWITNTRHQIIQNSSFTKYTSTINNTGLGFYINNSLYQTSTDNSTTIDNCVFRDNNNSLAGGSAAFRIFQGNRIRITNCEIAANLTFNGGAATVTSAASLQGKADNLFVSNCKFLNNSTVNSTSTGIGSGTLSLDSNTGTVKDCTFENNIGIRGGHLSFSGTGALNVIVRPNVVTFENCSFSGGSGTGIGGGAYSQSSNSIIKFKQCTFTANKTTATNGGALWAGFRSRTEFIDCDFQLNESATNGAALYIQNDTTEIYVKDSRFISNNTVSGSGGAFSMFGSASGVTFINNEFIGNSCTGSGGALNLASATNVEKSIGYTIIDRNLFEENVSGGGQGGAINTQGRGGLYQNNVFLKNEASNDGVGGAISYNHSDTLLRKELSLINNTFIQNTGALISGVAAWQSKIANKRGNGLVNLQNNIFIEQVGVGYEPNDTTLNVEVVSKGGNIYTTAASMAFMSASLDQVSGSFKLNDDFSPIAGSPAINYGTGNGAPLYDYNNLLRVGRPDAGAVEFGATVSGVKASDIKSLTIYPNPSADYIKVDELAVSNARYLIFSLDGKLVEKGSIPSNGQIDIKKLTVGNYYLQVNDGKLSIGSFVKQ